MPYKNAETRRSYQQDWYRRNAENLRTRAFAYYYSHIEAARAAMRARYHRDPAPQSARMQKWYKRNSEAHKARSKAWRESHPTEYRAYLKEYRAKNGDRLRAQNRAANRASYQRDPAPWILAGQIRTARRRGNGGSYTREEWLNLVALYGGHCTYCGATGRLGPDHIVPVVRGGTSDIENIVPACRRCNTSKGARPLIVFLARAA